MSEPASTPGDKEQPVDMGHKCFGCGKQIADMERHIHVGLDEWSGKQGMQTFGLDDLLRFPFCSDCTHDSPDGWTPERHVIEDDDDA